MRRIKYGQLALAILSALLLTACQQVERTPTPTRRAAATPQEAPPAAGAPDPGTAQPTAEPADLIFLNGSILTMDPKQPRAEALAAQGERILAVGSEDFVMRHLGPETRLVDLGGRALLPGFVDAHAHLFNDHESFGTDLLGGQELALSNGITTLANMYASEEFVEEMRNLDASGELIVRTSLYLSVTTNCGERTGDWWQAYPASRPAGGRLWIGGLKVFGDGGTCGRLAGTKELLPGYGLGDLFFSQEEMNDFLRQAQNEGYPLAIHAQGDRAIEQALNAFRDVLAGADNVLRHRIEHNAMVRPDQRSLYGEYDVVATLFGFHPVCDMPAWTDFYKDIGEHWRALLDANPGAHFAWHGDDPGVPPISPLLDLASLVTRQELREDRTVCEPPDWLRRKAITVEEGLHLMTMGSAYALFREAEVGSLEAGKFADLVVLDADPTKVEPEGLWSLDLMMTVVGGEVVYCSPESADLCERARRAAVADVEAEGSGSEAGGLRVRASRSLPGSPPESALDRQTGATGWVSGDHAPQWIEIDLGAVTHVTGLRLWVDQHPAGFTRHRILGGAAPDPSTVLWVLEGPTASGQLLEIEGDWDVRYLRVETVESPSWVAWFEVEVLSE